jgi:hypothetical protein
MPTNDFSIWNLASLLSLNSHLNDDDAHVQMANAFIMAPNRVFGVGFSFH